MPVFMDLTGQRFGELTVLGVADARKNGRHQWVCRCDCGREKVVLAYPLRCGHVTCCGAHRTAAFRDKNRKYPREHGLHSRLYVIWKAMQLRCYYPSHEAFPRYGGRGIGVCQEWRGNYLAFREWALSHGYEAPLTIDRIDNDLGYSPGNCRWITRKMQSRHRRKQVRLTAFGETKPLVEWAEDSRCVVNERQLRKRILAGHAAEHAITTTEHDLRSAASRSREAIQACLSRRPRAATDIASSKAG
jgi:hypothetical protein